MQRHTLYRFLHPAAAFLSCLIWAAPSCAEPAAPAKANAAFNAYTAAIEARLAVQHHSPGQFVAGLVPTGDPGPDWHKAGFLIEPISPPGGLAVPGALIHHWRGTAFVPGANVGRMRNLLADLPAYPLEYRPQVLCARVLSGAGNRLEVAMRVREQHVLTTVMDTDYDLTFGELDGKHGFSIAHSTRVAEIAEAGTDRERTLSPAEEHGFLWRQNTYWSYGERDGGLYVQVESISLTRSIPTGLGWAVRPFVESVPRESLAFTLAATARALRK